MTLITVGAPEEALEPLHFSKRIVVLIVAAVLASLCAGAVLFWKLWYCPGPLGRFDRFSCKCTAGSSKKKGQRRCSCDEFFEEKAGSCEGCGGLGQRCCSQGDPCQYTLETHYRCTDGVCSLPGPLGRSFRPLNESKV